MNTIFTHSLCRAFAATILTGLIALQASGQCTQTGTLAPGSASNDAGSGSFPFSSPSSAMAADNSYASATAVLTLLSGETDFLKLRGFGLSIPGGTSVCGIQVKISRRAAGISVLAWVTDSRVKLMKNGILVGANRAKPSAWTSTETTVTYGGPFDNWGTSWTAAELNSSNFGLAISAEINGLLTLLPSALIDDASVTVYYSHMTLPVKLVSFEGQQNSNHDVTLSWKTSGEDENTNFTIQRSTDGTSWTDVSTLAANQRNITGYTYTDRSKGTTKKYYRLAIRNSTGAVIYSDIVTVMDKPVARLNIYPNPATEQVTVESESRINTVKCFNATGVQQQVSVQRISENSSRVNVSALPTGLYYIQVDGEMLKLLKK